MPTALIVLVLLAFIPYVLAGLGGYAKIKQFGHLDNHHPRIQANKLEGVGARLMATQANAWEALAFYTATIVVVFASGVAWAELTAPALIFAATRVAHPVLYIANIATARSLVVVAGIGCCVYMLWLAF